MDNSKNKHSLGLAGNLTQTFMHSPLTLLLIIATFAIGFAGFMMTPRQEDPQISVPMVDVFVSYSGASTEQVASLVADPLERIMSEIPGVDHVYSASQRDQAMVTVQFEVGEEMGPSLVKLYDKLQSNMDMIPPGVSQPLVKPKGVDDVPMVALTLWSDSLDDAALRLIALDVMQELKEIPETSQSFVISGRQEQLRIEVKPERLAGYGITLEQIAGTIMTANSEKTVGLIESGESNFNLYTGSFLRNSEDVERLVVAMHDGNPVYVRDVADVIHGPGEAHKFVNFYTGPASTEKKAANGTPAVTLAIAKKIGTNGVSVVKDVLNRVDSMKGRLIPSNVEISVTRNYGKSAQDKVNGLMFKLVLVTVAVSILIFWFLNWRAALVCFIVIPNVILVTTFFALIMGYTIDRVSLFALIFSIGILVDDAIVVVENMYRRWAMDGEISDSTSIDAVREVGNPTILATFTVIAALLPMGMVRGMMGPYMEPIPALGSVAMMYSLFAAFAFTPYLAIRFKPAMDSLHEMEEAEHKTVKRLDGFYRGILNPLIDSKFAGNSFLISLFIIFFICCSLFYFKAVKVKMMPLDNKGVFNVVINFPEGTSLPITANLTRQFAEEVRKISEVTAIQSYVGTASPFDFNGLVRHYYLRQQPWQADLNVQLLHKKDRDRSSHEIALEVREILSDFVAKKVKAGVYTQLSKPKFQIVEMPPGPPVLQTMVAEVYGPTAHERHEVAMQLTELFKQASTITDVDNYIQKPYEIWNFRVNREKAIRAGVSVDAINTSLEMAMGGFVLGDIKDGSILEATMIVLQVPLDIRANFNNLSQLPVPTMQGGSVPLAELGVFIKGSKEAVIYHKDLRAVEYVIGEVIGEFAAPIYGIFEVGDMLALEENFGPRKEQLSGTLMGPPDASDMHKHSGFEWTGEWTVTYETFRDMGLAFGVAIILIYMLVVWEFGNFRLPAVIISSIPLTLVGIIPGHAIMGSEFTATSMIGFIALAGIIVRNSILLVDYSRQEIGRGVEVKEAIIMACITRTRPIVITALALVVGSTAILMDPIFQGMAVSLMFGVFVSTILTLIVIPLGCYSARSAFCDVMREDHPDYQDCVEDKDKPKESGSSGGSTFVNILFSTYSIIVTVVQVVWWSLQGVYTLLFKRTKKADVTPQATTPKTTAVPAPKPVDKPEPAASKPAATTVAAKEPEVKAAPKVDNVAENDSKPVVTENITKADASEPEKVEVSDSGATTADTKQATEKAAVKKKSVVKKKTVKKKVVTKKSVSTKKSTLSDDKKTSGTVKKAVKKKGRRGIQLKGGLGEE
ncbi:MAG: efflux RND transporter permease subunit [gamma proteobacterium symbiont of Lucinoma myriamae]|nr:efflux RND transporter permease subunit [gamma proteobacterium symbiont of Lucinoma myriamae]MCU7818745.1 efflux RND transporter permease subunit [gamma proteobacterium symbiont of Lucinoma myriamae]MCU7831285.1 efflux RND transporter permease subunit [gamma proteobacterium symbiont of Lucinoma myriamae]